jgi:uncharacterized membrane protein
MTNNNFKKSSWKYKNMSPSERGITIVLPLLPLTALLTLHIIGVTGHTDDHYIKTYFESFVKSQLSLWIWLAYIFVFSLLYMSVKKRHKYYATLSAEELAIIKQQHKKYVVLWGLFVVSAPFIGVGFTMLEEFIKKSKTIKTVLAIIGWLIASVIYLLAKADIRKQK